MAESGGTRIGTMIAEIDLDARRYDAGLRQALTSAQTTTQSAEQAWRRLGTGSTETIDRMRANAVRSYETIRNSATSTAADIERAERATMARLEQINRRHYGNTVSQIQQVEAAAQRSTGVISQMFAAFSLSNIAVDAVYKLGNAITQTFKDGFNAVEEYRLGTASLAATITTFADKTTGTSLGDIYKQAYQYSGLVVEKLEEWDARTVATGVNLRAMVETMAQGGVLLDVTNKRQEEGTIAIANAIAIVTKGQNADIQFRQEIRGLIDGEVKATHRLATMIDATLGGALKDNIEKWREQGTVIENIGTLLVGFTSVTKDLESTWLAVSSTMETIYNKILRGMFVPVYEDIIDLGMQITTNALDQDSALSSAGELLKNVIYRGWIDIKNVVEIIGDTLSAFEVPLKFMGTLLGLALDGWGQILAAVEVVWSRVTSLVGAMWQLVEAAGNYGKMLYSAVTFRFEEMNQAWDDTKASWMESGKKTGEALSAGIFTELENNLVEYNKDLTAISTNTAAKAPKMQTITNTEEAEEAEKAAKKAAKAAESAAKKAANEQQRIAEQAAKEHLKIVEKFQDDYDKITLNSADYQRSKLEEEKREYEKHVKDKDALNRWYASELKKIEDQQIEDFQKGFKENGIDYEKMNQDIIDSEKDKADSIRDLLEQQRQDYEDFVYDVQAATSDMFMELFDGGFGSLFEEMETLFKRTLANMAAEAITKPIVIPVIQSIAGTVGGTVASAMGIPSAATQGGGFNASSITGVYNAVSGGLETGVYKALTSGILNTAGSSLFGATAWGGVAATTPATSGIMAAGQIMGGAQGIAGAIAAAAPWAAIAAVAIPLITKLFEDDPEPFLRVQTTSTSRELSNPNYRWANGEGVSPAGFDYNLTLQDIDSSESREALYKAITGMLDAQFTAIEDTLNVSVNDAIVSAQNSGSGYGDGFFSKIDLAAYEDNIEGALNALSEDLLADIRDELVVQLTGAQGSLFDADFFDSIAAEGETAIDTFLRFGKMVESTDDFMAEFTRQTEVYGESAYQAFQNITTISAVMDQLSIASKNFTDNSAITTLEEIDAAYQGLVETLKASNATVEDLAAAEQYRLQELGAAITGLTATSVATALWNSIQNGQDAEAFVSSLENQIREGVAQTLLNSLSEGIYSAFISPINSAIASMVSQIISGGMTTGAALSASMPVIKDSLDSAITLMKNEDFKALINNLSAEISTLLPASGDSYAVDTQPTTYDTGTSYADLEAAREDAAQKERERVEALADLMSEVRISISDSGLDEYALKLAQINRATDASIVQAAALGAAESDLAMIREWGAIQIAQVMDEQAAKLADMMDKTRIAISDAGLSDYVQEITKISREMEENISIASALGATEQELAEIRSLGAIETQAVIDEFYNSVVGLAEIQEKIRGISSIVDDQVLYYQIASLFDIDYSEIAQYSKQELIDAFMSTSALEWGTILGQEKSDKFASLMASLASSLEADNARLESLVELHASLAGDAEKYADQYRQARLSDMFNWDFSNLTDSQTLDAFEGLSEIDMQAIAAQLGDITSEFIDIISNMADDIKEQAISLAQARIDINNEVSSAFGTVTPKSFDDLMAANKLSNTTSSILSSSKYELTYGAVSEEQAYRLYDELANALDIGTIGLDQFNQAIDLVINSIKEADGLRAFQIAMAKQTDIIDSVSDKYQSAILVDGIKYQSVMRDMITSMEDSKSTTEDLQSASDDLASVFSSVAASATALAGAGAMAANVLMENLGGLFTSGLKETGYSSESQIDELIKTLRERVKIGNDEVSKIIASTISPAGEAHSELMEIRQKAVDELQTKTGEQAEILENTISSMTAELEELSVAIASATAAIAKPQAILSTISSATDLFESTIKTQKALPLAENKAIYDAYLSFMKHDMQSYVEGATLVFPTEALAAIADVKKGDEDSYASALSELVDMLANQQISSDLFNTTFEIGSKIFTGEIDLEIKDKLQNIKTQFESFFSGVFDTVSSVIVSSTEIEKYTILKQATEWNDSLSEQIDAFSKLTDDSSDEYKKIKDTLEIAPGVISKWVDLKFLLLDMDEMRSVGSSRANISGTSTSWSLSLLEGDFQNISAIQQQVTVLSKYMTSSWAETQSWMASIGYSADDFSAAMQTISESLRRVQAVSDSKAEILGKTNEYQLAKNAVSWGLSSDAFDSSDKQQDWLNWFLNQSSESIVEWTDSMGLNTETFISNIQDMASNLKETNKTFEGIIKTLEDYQSELLDSNSLLSPDALYRKKISEWTANVTDMYSSDPAIAQDAVSKFPTLSNDLLAAAQKTMTDQYAYQALWGKIYAESEKARVYAKDQITQSSDEFTVIQGNWKELLELNNLNNDILINSGQEQALSQKEISKQIDRLSDQTDSLAKSEDFDTFFVNMSSLFSSGSEWVTSLRTSITSVYDSMESGKLLFSPLQTSLDAILSAVTPSTSATDTVPTGVNNYYINTGHDDPAQDAYALIYNRMGIPGYASGGYHDGGPAIVGEIGPELINVGPSRIFSNSDTSDLLGSAFDISGIVKEIKLLRYEMKKMKEYQYQNLTVNTKAQKSLSKWDENGLSVTVVA